MFCSYCGKKIDDNLRYCIYCGEKVAGIANDAKESEELSIAVKGSVSRHRCKNCFDSIVGTIKRMYIGWETLMIVVIAFGLIVVAFAYTDKKISKTVSKKVITDYLAEDKYLLTEMREEELGRVIAEGRVSYDEVTKYFYDCYGTLIFEMSEVNGEISEKIQYAYDEYDRLAKKETLHLGILQSETYTYKEDGSYTVYVSHWDDQQEYYREVIEYDSNGNWTKWDSMNSENWEVVSSNERRYTYNDMNQVVKEEHFFSEGGEPYVITYEYDTQGRVIHSTEGDSTEITYLYDEKNGLLSKKIETWKGDFFPWETSYEYEYEFDSNQNLIKEVQYWNDGMFDTIYTIHYEYQWLPELTNRPLKEVVGNEE